MALKLGELFQGLAGNLQQQDLDKINNEFGKYLLEDETVENAYKLVRDVVLFTNIRIIIVDKQGATGKKTSFKSIFLMNLVNVEMETAGFGIDDSEITIAYMANVNRKANTQDLKGFKFEFPKNQDISELYTKLMSIAYKNRKEINS